MTRASPLEPDAGGASVTLHGVGLHSGRPCRVTLSRRDGPLAFTVDDRTATLAELSVTRTDFGVEVALGANGPRVDGVEHLLAAFAGLGVRDGVVVAIDGGEMPLLDGASLAFARALEELAPERRAPSLVVEREGTIDVAESSYVFRPGDVVHVEVSVAFAAPRVGAQRATWDGTADAFVRDVAWARTFGFRRDADALLGAGRARGADATSVMVMDDDGAVLPPGAPARPGEHARHKLLDFVGDAALHGGPPRGSVFATRPGHRATHTAMTRAVADGILRRA